MLRHTLGLAALFATVSAFAACNGQVTTIGTAPDGGPTSPSDGGPNGPVDDPNNPLATGATTASKVDVLFVVDNSSTMGTKAKILSDSIPALLQKVATTGDVHVGVITTSLGAFGGDVCPDTTPYNTMAHLATTGAGQQVIAPDGIVTLAGGTDQMISTTRSLIEGVGSSGCGLEAQLESTYRFLVAPDPWVKVAIVNGQASFGTAADMTVLQQRAQFLRPDSLLLVVLLTDEDDSAVDPKSIAGQGWAFMANQFPGSSVFRADGKTTTAPRSTSICQSDPGNAACTSCGFGLTCDRSFDSCNAIRGDENCKTNNGYYGPQDDDLNVRFFHMKERYGIDPQYPVSRYIDAFSRTMVPDRDNERAPYPAKGTPPQDPLTGVPPYLGTPHCTNPLFAASLPSKVGDELCSLPRGPRGKELVLFTVIGGVPEALVGAGFDTMLGKDPVHFDYTGVDFRMLQSTAKRPNQPDDYDTKNVDLQYACTFPLAVPIECGSDFSCPCAGGAKRPICSGTMQISGSAVPSIRPLEVVRGLGDGGLVGSVCPTDITQGYASTMTRIIDRIAPKLVAK